MTVKSLKGQKDGDTMRIFISGSFEGIHRYDGAPEEVNFLRDPHRHNFGYKVEMDVYHDDRELEFILVKREIQSWFVYDQGNNSCEMIARELKAKLIERFGDRNYVIVIDEDGENGCILK